MTRKQRDARNAAIVAQARLNVINLIESHRDTELWRLAEDAAPLWYPGALKFAEELSAFFNVSVETACGIIAAFSIQTRWSKNQKDAIAFFTGDDIRGGFSIRYEKAVEILAYEKLQNMDDRLVLMSEVCRILNGPKITRFAHTILNPRANCVVIDLWIKAACGITDAQLKWAGMYELLEIMLKELAHEYGFEVYSIFQAFVWILVRGSAD